MNEQVQCDICGTTVKEPEGYQLTTAQVVSAPGFWRDYYERHKDELTQLGVTSYDAFLSTDDVRQAVVEKLVRDSTPWLLCEQCIHLFDVDRQQARTYARQWWESDRTFTPPGTGPASLSDVSGLEGVLFSLIPLSFLDGEVLFRWSRVAWLGSFAFAAYWFFQILLNPRSGYLDAFTQDNVVITLILLAVYGVLTVGFWLYFRRRGQKPGES